MAEITCRHRHNKLFGRYTCVKADFNGPCDKNWKATNFICKTCRALIQDSVYDCVHYDISTKKVSTDKPDITVISYCLLKSPTKESWNEITNMGECGTSTSPHNCKHAKYEKRPIADAAKSMTQMAGAATEIATTPVPLKLKIWMLLPAVLSIALGIFGLLLGTLHWQLVERDWTVVDEWISWIMLSIGFLIGVFAISLVKGNKRSFKFYKRLIVVSGVSWIFYLYKLSELKHFIWSFNILELITSAYLLFSFAVTAILLFSKLPKIRALLYPQETMTQPKRVFKWAKGHLLKGDVIVFLVIISFIIGAVLTAEKGNKPIVHPSSNPVPDRSGELKVIVPEDVKGKWRAVKLLVKNKKSKKTRAYTVNTNSEFNIPNSNLRVAVGDFMPDFKIEGNNLTSSTNDPKNPSVAIRVYENDKQIFPAPGRQWGWLFAKVPSLHPVKHSLYSIILKEGISSSGSASAPAPEKPIRAFKHKEKKNLKVSPVAKEALDSINRHIEEGKSLHNSGRYDKAIEEFNMVLKFDPNNQKALQGIRDAQKADEVIKSLR